MTTITVAVREPFDLRKGLCLEATAPVNLLIPRALFVEGVAFGDIVRLSSDEIEVGLVESPSALVVVMRPSDRIVLGRSSEVVALHDTEPTVSFNVIAD